MRILKGWIQLIDLRDVDLQQVECTNYFLRDFKDSDCQALVHFLSLVSALFGFDPLSGSLAVVELIPLHELIYAHKLRDGLLCLLVVVQQLPELLIVFWSVDLAAHVSPFEVLYRFDQAIQVLLLLKNGLLLGRELEKLVEIVLHLLLY